MFQCSTTCGDGTQTRVLNCTSDGLEVDISNCGDASNYNTTQDCNLQDCPVFVTTAWSEVLIALYFVKSFCQLNT